MGDKYMCQVGQKDVIRINNLTLPISLDSGAQWPTKANKPVEQPIAISLSIFHDISRTANADALVHSINYADLADEVRTAVFNRSFACLQDLSRHICNSLPIFSSLKDVVDGLEVKIKVSQSKAFLHCRTIAFEHVAKFSANNTWTAHDIIHLVEDLTCPTIVGVEDHERLEHQNVIVNIALKTGTNGIDRGNWINTRDVMETLYKTVSASRFLTLESLTAKIASKILNFPTISHLSPVVSVSAAKPSALPLAQSAEVHIVRTLSDDGMHPMESSVKKTEFSTDPEASLAKVAIALGSNLGDSFQNIEYALRLLEIPQDILGNESMVLSVTNTSFMYETAPMYVTDQPSFINCACMVETDISPMLLLDLLKKIEAIVGRVPSIRNGPRAVDLDIILYDDIVMDTRLVRDNLDNLEGELVIPHPRLQEREFVLRPLTDMIPDYVHPVLNKSIDALFKDICDPTGPPMNKVIPFPRLPLSMPASSGYRSILPVPETLIHWTYITDPSGRAVTGKSRKTHVMATLNVTPDSFSDGATHNALPAALAYACSSVYQGATIIDVGGYSTRPGAAFVCVDEEINRVVPAVSALRNSQSLKEVLIEANEANADLLTRVVDTPISVDTFRWEVAEAAIKAGASCINDVYAFTGPDSWPTPDAGSSQGEKAAEYMTKMKAVARKYAVPVILMHSRGDAGKNKDYSAYQYTEERLETLEGVRVELGAKVDQIVLGKGGVRRWLIIVDPGVGFSKTLEGNLQVLRSAKEVVADVQVGNSSCGFGLYRNPLKGYPQLIGVSRKSFLGAILAQDPKGRETLPRDRTWATAAAVTCAVQQDALVVRVHDVKEMVDVVKVAESLWL